MKSFLGIDTNVHGSVYLCKPQKPKQNNNQIQKKDQNINKGFSSYQE